MCYIFEILTQKSMTLIVPMMIMQAKTTSRSERAKRDGHGGERKIPWLASASSDAGLASGQAAGIS